MNRREFLQTGSGIVSGMLLLKPSTAFGYEANSAVRHGLLGCGNRGTAVATSFAQNTSARLLRWPICFADKLAAGQDHFDKVNASLGQPAHRQQAALSRARTRSSNWPASHDVDLIQISTPPFFHVQHLEAAVAAGKHVYCEKPVGIDVAQAKQALEIAKRVKPNQSVDVGFQCRNAPPIAAMAEKDQGRRAGQDRHRLRQLQRACVDREEARRRRAGRVPAAQLALGSRALRRHSGRAEHSHHRPLQLDAGRASAEGHRHRRPQYSDALRRLLG